MWLLAEFVVCHWPLILGIRLWVLVCGAVWFWEWVYSVVSLGVCVMGLSSVVGFFPSLGVSVLLYTGALNFFKLLIFSYCWLTSIMSISGLICCCWLLLLRGATLCFGALLVVIFDAIYSLIPGATDRCCYWLVPHCWMVHYCWLLLLLYLWYGFKIHLSHIHFLFTLLMLAGFHHVSAWDLNCWCWLVWLLILLLLSQHLTQALV